MVNLSTEQLRTENIIKCALHTWNNVALSLSGGFDSTLLAWTTLKILAETGWKNKVWVATVARSDDSVKHSSRISEWLKSQYPHIMLNWKIVGNPQLHHSQQVSSGITDILVNSDSVVLLGDTKNPQDLPGGPRRTISTNPRVVQPYIEHDKRYTVSFAAEYGQLNTIASLSHTCTESVNLRCGLCWQCRERAWAFSKTKHTDTGVM